MSQNRAAWLPVKMAKPFKIDEAPMPSPEPDQVVIRVRAVAMNPADAVLQNAGAIYENYPIIPGCDVSGEIVELGADVKGWAKGDRVIAPLVYGAFQLYCAVDSSFMAKIPDSVAFKNGVVLPLPFATATVSLYEEDMLNLDRPQAPYAPPNGKVLIVWGGSSAVGSGGIQLARASGYEVATLCSPRNSDYCKKLGAKYVFDYNNENVVDDIVKELKGQDSAGVLCAIIGEGVVRKSALIAKGLGGDQVVAVMYPPGMPVPDEIPDGVGIKQCWKSFFDKSPAAKQVFSEWLPAALEQGNMKCQPDPDVVGQGLESIQEAVDRMSQGVSAKKLVVELP